MASDMVPADVTPLMSFIERAARDQSFDLVKFEAMLRLQREVEREQQRRAFNADMALVQEEIGDIKRTGKNPTFTNPYAKLEDLDREARPIYTGRGFSVRYGSRLTTGEPVPLLPGHVRMVLVISHRAGYTEEHHLDGPMDTQGGPRGRSPIQAVGSTVTYLRRYLLQMVLNLVPASDPVDDDGEGTRRGAPTNGGDAGTREGINRDVPFTRKSSQEVWLDKLEEAAAGCSTREAWDVLWTTPTIVAFGTDPKNHGDAMTRYQEIQLRHARRLFPTDAEQKETVDGQQTA